MEFPDYGKFCKEVREYKSNDIITKKRRQQLRANNHELRELARHLQSAVVNQQLNDQLRNAAQLKKSELQKEIEENAKRAAEIEQARKLALKQEEQARQDKKMLMETLNCQMNRTNEKARKELEDAYNDRKHLEILMQQIQAEEIAKQKENELMRVKCKKEIEKFYEDKRLKQQLEKERNADENKRLLAYQIQCEKARSEKVEDRKRILKEKEDLSKILSQQLSLINTEKEKREQLLLSLSIQEHKAKEEQDFKEALKKQISNKEKNISDIKNYYNEAKIRKEMEFKEEEEKFRALNLRYLEERDKLWQLSEEKRRRKIKEHFKELREIIEQRRYQRAKKIAEQILEFEKIKTDNDKSDLLVEQERVIMLNSVPKDLLPYLPPGVLKSSDFEILQK